MDLNELIIKTETQRNTVIELIQDPKKTVDELDKEMAVERFLKGFLDDLKRLRESQNSSTSKSALPISDVGGTFTTRAIIKSLDSFRSVQEAKEWFKLFY